MSTPVTRLLRFLPGSPPKAIGPLPDVVKQEAIAWCTTHDLTICEAVTTNDAGGDPHCSGSHNAFASDCTISTSGPEHKWWRDVSENIGEEE